MERGFTKEVSSRNVRQRNGAILNSFPFSRIRDSAANRGNYNYMAICGNNEKGFQKIKRIIKEQNMSKDHKKYNFIADRELADKFEKKLIDDKVNGRRRYKSQTAFFTKKMEDYVK